jgi:hypothetical protein
MAGWRGIRGERRCECAGSASGGDTAASARRSTNSISDIPRLSSPSRGCAHLKIALIPNHRAHVLFAPFPSPLPPEGPPRSLPAVRSTPRIGNSWPLQYLEAACVGFGGVTQYPQFLHKLWGSRA